MFDTTALRPVHRAALVAAVSVTLLAPAAAMALPAAGPGAAPAGRPSATSQAGPVAAPVAAPVADRIIVRSGPARPAAQPRSTREARRADFAHFTLRSRATRDLHGVERSLYRGRYFRPGLEDKRRCIAQRESEGYYTVVSSSGSYFGAYQVSRELARGATWMMLPEHRRLLGAATAKRILADLRQRPMNTWPRYWQDAAFSTVMNWEHTGSGASHWAGGRWHC